MAKSKQVVLDHSIFLEYQRMNAYVSQLIKACLAPYGSFFLTVFLLCLPITLELSDQQQQRFQSMQERGVLKSSRSGSTSITFSCRTAGG